MSAESLGSTTGSPSSPAPAAPRWLAGRAIDPVGLGCMGMSEFYGESDRRQSLATLHAAVELGVQHFDTADTYGFGHNESLLGEFLSELAPSARARLTVATKFGIVREPGRYERRIDNSAAYVEKACEASLRRLGVERIDLYYCHRRDPAVPIEDLMETFKTLVAAGKIAAAGLSEVQASTLRAAQAVHPVAALQSEYSLWERSAETDLLPLTQELGIAFVAYSPLGRAFLTQRPPQIDTLEPGDFRRALPRFNGAAGEHNRVLQKRLAALALSIDVPVASLALAWVLARQPHVLPIPGTRNADRLRANHSAGTLVVPSHVLRSLDELFAHGAVQGERYPEAGWVGMESPKR